MPTYKPWFVKGYSLPIIDREGRAIGHQEMHSPSASYLMPDEKFCLVNWKTGFKDAPTADLILKPITLPQDLSNGMKAGSKVYGYFGWGSAAKNGVTIGAQRDFVKLGLGAGPVDGQRAGRIYFSNSIHGAAVATLKVGIAQEHTVVPGVGPIEDGFDYYDADLVRAANDAKLNRRVEPQTPENARDTYATDERVSIEEKVILPDGRTVWQSTGVWEEFIPIIQARIDALTIKHTPAQNIQVLNDAHQEWKGHLVALEPMMSEHPFIAKALVRDRADRAMRLASSLPKGSKVRVAVPTTAKVAALPIGKYILHRMPPTAWGTIQAHNLEQQDDAEIERIAKMGVAQTSIVNADLASKGQGGIVEGLKALTGYDAILCAENIKMASSKYAGKSGVRKLKEVTLENCYFGIIAQVAPGHCVGVDAPTMKRMKGDFDGDIVYVTDCSQFPSLFNVVSKYPSQEAAKLPKLPGFWPAAEDRPRVIAETMDDIIGFATNLLTETFAPRRDRDSFAHDSGWSGLSPAMDAQVSYLCQIGEDLFKTDLAQLKSRTTGLPLSLRSIHAEASALQVAMRKVAGKMAPWSGWKSDPDAFKTMIPEVYNEGLMNHLDKDSSRVKNSVPPNWDSTVARIAQYVLPQLAVIIEDAILTRPLTEYQGWATLQRKELLQEAERYQLVYDGKSNHLNWSDKGEDGEVRKFMVWLEVERDAFLARTGATPEAAANALWYVAHGARSKNAGASSVFMTFPDEAESIVVNKPGLFNEQVRTIVMGLNPLVKSTRCEGEIVEFTSTKGVMKAFVPKNAALLKPGNRYAAIPRDKPQLRLGPVTVDISKESTGSWNIEVISRP